MGKMLLQIMRHIKFKEKKEKTYTIILIFSSTISTNYIS